MNNAPIGIFDSGSGGLSIYQAIRSLLPHESFVYLGDHSNLPYGDKSTDFIQKRTARCIRFLVTKKAKLIVVACNTATVAGIDYVRHEFPDIPIVGVVPVVKTAAAMSTTKQFVVLSTPFTAASDYQKELIRKWAPDCTVITIGSSRLVSLIERGLLKGPEIDQELKHMFHEAKDIPFDVVVLGCTHFPFVGEAVRAIVGNRVGIIDSGGAVARQVQRILTHRNDTGEATQSSVQFMTTGDSKVIASVFTRLLGREVNVTHVTV
jgi:glutamate racemase